MAKSSLPAPTLDFLLSLRTEQEQVFSDDNAQIDRMRQVRTLSRPTIIDQKYRINDIEVRDPTLADEIQRVVATLSVNPPTIRVIPPRIGDTAEANATLREKWTEAVLDVAGTHPTGHTRQQMVDACVGDGGSWTKLLFKSDMWEHRFGIESGISDDDDLATTALKAKAYDALTEDAKKVAGPPFVWQSVDVRNVNPLWTGIRLTGMLEVQERPIHAALRDFQLGIRSGRKGIELVPEVLGQPMNKIDAQKRPKTVLFLEFWDREWCSYVVVLPGGVPGSDARIVKQFRHRYGRVPYFYAPGYTFNWQTNHKVAWSIGESKRWLVEYVGYLETIHAQVAARDAFTPLIRSLPEMSTGNYGDSNAPVLPEFWEIRQIYNLRPGEKLEPLQFPGVGPALKEQIQMAKEQLQSLVSPKMQTASGSGLEGAGFAINQVLAEARVTQDPICKHLEQMMTEVTRFLWKLVRERVQETVWVRAVGKAGTTWMGAGPDDLADTVLLEWHLDPERPSAKLIEERYWHERIEKGTAGRHMAITEMGSNPDEVDDDRELDRIRQTDWYQKRHDLLLMQRLERGDILLEAAQQAITTGQLPGGATTPLMPGNPQAATPPPGFPQPPQPGAGAQGMGTQAVPDMGQLALQPSPGRPGPGPAGLQSLGGAPPSASAAPGAMGLR